jgi:hypothetical protein
MKETLAEKTARASRFPERLVNPQLESRAMKNKQTKTKFDSAFRAGSQLIARVVCLGAIILICSSAPGQNLFVSSDAGGGNIYEFTPNGVRSTFASGLTGALAFDKAGNLFVADRGNGAIYKITPAGLRTTFARIGPSNWLGL